MTTLGLFVRSPNDSVLRFGLYQDLDGAPGDLLVATADVPAVLGETEGAVSIALEPGTYWILVSNLETLEVASGTPIDLAYRILDFEEPLPDPFGDAQIVDSGRLGLYLVGELP